VKLQPSYEEKLSVMRGEPSKWEYSFDPKMLPCTAHTRWTAEDWIRFVGDRWFIKSPEQFEAAIRAAERDRNFDRSKALCNEYDSLYPGSYQTFCEGEHDGP
jgi:hypothetical protein